MAQCVVLTAADQRCRMPALKTSEYCISHDPAKEHERQQTAFRAGRASGQARRRKLLTPAPGDASLSTRAGIQRMLDLLLRLHLAGEISDERARIMQRTLSIAARNFDTPARKTRLDPIIGEHEWPTSTEDAVEHVLEAIDASKEAEMWAHYEMVRREQMRREQRALDLQGFPVLQAAHHKLESKHPYPDHSEITAPPRPYADETLLDDKWDTADRSNYAS